MQYQEKSIYQKYWDLSELPSGVEFAYSFYCNFLVWIYSHNMKRDYDDDIIKEGKEIHKYKFSSYVKELEVARIKMDVVKIGKKFVVYERKLNKITNSAIMQLKYYLYNLKIRGIDAEGFIIIPGKRKKVILSYEDINNIELQIKKIKEIISLENPPLPEKTKKCKKCAYFTFCFGDSYE